MLTAPSARPFDGDLIAEWDDLVDRIDGTPFHRPGWFGAWWDAFGVGDDPEIVTVRRAGRLAAVLPVIRRGTVLTGLTNWHSFVYGPVACDGEAAAELIEKVLAMSRWSVELSHLMPSDVELAGGVAAASGCHLRTSVVQRSPFVPPEGTFAEYVGKRASRHVKQLERNRAKLHDAGSVTVTVHEGADDLGWALEEFIRVEALGWKGESGTAIASMPATQRFYRNVAAWASGAGMLRIPLLGVDGRIVAGELDIEDGRSTYSLKAGFDPALRRTSPGLILMVDMIRRSLDLDRSYELLGSDEPYKMRWADQTHLIRRMRIYPATVAGRAARCAHDGHRTLVRGAALGKRLARTALDAAERHRRAGGRVAAPPRRTGPGGG